jgi:hypothetical protein
MQSGRRVIPYLCLTYPKSSKIERNGFEYTSRDTVRHYVKPIPLVSTYKMNDKKTESSDCLRLSRLWFVYRSYGRSLSSEHPSSLRRALVTHSISHRLVPHRCSSDNAVISPGFTHWTSMPLKSWQSGINSGSIGRIRRVNPLRWLLAARLLPLHCAIAL